MADNVMDRVLTYGVDSGIRRGDEGRWVAGVCLGLGRRWGVDPVLLRVGFLLLTVLAALGPAVYLLCWLLLPAADSSIALERAVRRGDGAAITLLVFTVIAVVGTLTPDWDGRPLSLFGLVVLALVVWFIVRQGRTAAPARLGTSAAGPVPGTSPSSPAPDAGATGIPRPSVGTDEPTTRAPFADAPTHPMPVIAAGPTDRVTGHRAETSTWAPPPAPDVPAPRRRTSWPASMLVAGLATLAYLGVDALPFERGEGWMLPMAASLVVLGCGLVVTAATRRRPPLVALAAWLLGVSLVTSLAYGGPQRAGDVLWRPTTPAAIQARYESGVGDTVLDLTAVPAVDEARHIAVDHGVGELEIRLPAGVSASITPDLGVGAFRIRESGRTREVAGGTDVNATVTVGTGPSRYDIAVQQGVGEVTVVVTDIPIPTTSEATP